MNDSLFPDLPAAPAPKRTTTVPPPALVSRAVMDFHRPPGLLRRIEVMTQDIDGATNCAGNSPVARAVRRELHIEPGTRVFVWKGHVEIDGHRFALPKAADHVESRFIQYGPARPGAILGAEPVTFEFNDRDEVTTL